MKWPLCILMVLLLGTMAGAQTHTRDYYLQKSKNQNTTGWILLAGGSAMAIVGGASFNSNFNTTGGNGKTDAAGFLMLAGVGSCLTSIPFFVSSAGNARKAANISIGYEHIDRQPTCLSTYQPALIISIKINQH